MGAAVWGFGAAVLWPWWGPHVVVPCPVATELGCWLAAVGGGLQVAVAMRKD